MSKVLVVINPNSGDSNNESLQDILKEKLSRKFDDVDIVFTEKALDAVEFAKRASREKYEAICSVGGDGTLNEIFGGLKNETHVPKLIIIPGGTGNILSKMLGMPQNPTDAIEKINFDETQKLDIAEIADKCFSISFSIGAIPESVHDVSSEDKTKFGMFAYFINIIKNIGVGNDYKVKVTTEDEVFEGEVDHLIITLTNRFGGFKFSDVDSDLDDGYANIYILTSSNFLDKVSTASDAVFGKLEKNDNIRHLRAKKIKIDSLDHREIPTDIDGDEGPQLPVEINIIESKIEFYGTIK